MRIDRPWRDRSREENSSRGISESIISRTNQPEASELEDKVVNVLVQIVADFDAQASTDLLSQLVNRNSRSLERLQRFGGDRIEKMRIAAVAVVDNIFIVPAAPAQAKRRDSLPAF